MTPDVPSDLLERYRTWATSAKAQIGDALARDDLSARHSAYELAHSLAGVAGNFGEPELGRWAAALCRYLRRCGEAEPDPATLAHFRQVYARLQDASGEPPVQEVAALEAYAQMPA
ncbi:MAG: Hpt domain-containing protein [Magnetospirillum sp.]|nr:Hpt domain-containing protein [Magnetospirillum sp.]